VVSLWSNSDLNSPMMIDHHALSHAPAMVLRQPLPAELGRVAHLFRNVRLRPDSHFIVAEKTHPIARFIAAAVWWTEGNIGRFQLACQPGLLGTDAPASLVQSVLAAAHEAGLAAVHFADLLPEGHPWLQVLQAQGFELVRSERSFETASRNTWTRIKRLYDKHCAAIPPDWRTDPIHMHGPEVIMDLIAPHRLLLPDEVRQYWQAAAAGFDLEMSCILFDGDRPFGAFLARRPADVLYVDVQVVKEPNPRLRSLADLCLVYHVVRRVQPDGPIRLIRFRCGETEHRQTANLALRMGGRELPRMHVFGKRLN
jgi:hypothetical protein